MMNFSMMLQKGTHPETIAPTGTPSISGLSAKNVVSGVRWYGRASVVKLLGGVLVLVYREADAHADNGDAELCIRFSSDYGSTWTAKNTYLDGSAVSGFPMYPAGGTPSDLSGPGEPWLFLAPNGDLLLHMWNSDYNTTTSLGSWQSRSTDQGKSWSTPAVIDFQGISNDNRIFSTEDDFIIDNTVYIGSRIYATDLVGLASGIKNAFYKSTDNGITWQYISSFTPDFTTYPTTEAGFQYVGNNKIVAMIRDANRLKTYYTYSEDMGQTWETVTDIASTFEPVGRPRIKTRSQLKGARNWWLDPVLICTGFEFTSGTGVGHPRRNAVWVSVDFGQSWSAPLYLDVDYFDGGYGDIDYNQITDEYIVLSYVDDDDPLMRDAIVRQYNFKIIWE